MNTTSISRRDYLKLLGASAAALTAAELVPADSPTDRANLLWYRQPATQWNEALALGNGRLGAMVFGGVQSERLQLNEDSVWAGEKRNRNNPEAARALPEVRSLLLLGKLKEAEQLADRAIIATPRRMPPYQPLGDLLLRFLGQDAASDYRRELDLATGIARISYQANGARFTREIFSSAADQVIVLRLDCDKPGGLSFAATLTREADSKTTAVNPSRVTIEGEAIARDDRHLRTSAKSASNFHGVLQVLNEGGKTRAEGNELIVEGANSATLFFAAATSYRHKNPPAKCEQYLAAAKKPYADLRAMHVADHQRLFRRVEFKLQAPIPDLPTDERLKRVQAGETDLALETLYFQFGRYLLIASSRPGHAGRHFARHLE
jgi:alpha-L-fucosidase 2